MQSINGVLDAPIAFTPAPLQFFPVNNLHVAATATDRPAFSRFPATIDMVVRRMPSILR
jgi:hypothetical protein